MDIYQKQILEHVKTPHNFGHIDKADVISDESNPSCGDSVSIELKIENNIIVDIMFTGSGCAVSQASASLMTDKVKGMNIEDILQYSQEDQLELLGITLSPSRKRCALVAHTALQNAVKNFRGKLS